MKDQKCIVFAGKANPLLAKLVSVPSHGITLGEIYHHQFPSDEWYSQIKENVRGADVFLLQSIIHPANDNLMQLLIMTDAARRASAARITAIIPYMGYSRQDRKDKVGTPISAKLVMDILQAAGVNHIVTMDLHAPQIAGFTNLPFDHLHFRTVLIEEMKDKNIEVIVAPDIGAVKKAEEYAQKMSLDLAFISKKRKDDITVETSQFVGDVKDKTVLIIDDLIESGGTLVAAAKACKENGAKKVYCAATHNCISPIGRSRLHQAWLDNVIHKFYCSDSTDCVSDTTGYIKILSVADLFSTVIHNIHNNNDKSITSLFTKPIVVKS